MSRFVASTLLPSTDSTVMRLSPSRVTSALSPSLVNTTADGPDFSSPSLTLPAGVRVPFAIVKAETVPSLRLATSASVPARLIETPAAPRPACRVAATFGGEALRSMTLSLSSGTVFVASFGSTFVAPVTRAKLSSGATATLKGGPTTLAGACTSPISFGGEADKSMIETVSGGGFWTVFVTPSSSTALPSFAETATSVRADAGASASPAATSTPQAFRSPAMASSVVVRATRSGRGACRTSLTPRRRDASLAPAPGRRYRVGRLLQGRADDETAP